MEKTRKDFPFLISESQKPLIYFDNAATSQKPQQVINAISHFYAHENAPVHRGIYRRAENITQLYEHARMEVASFIGAYNDEIVFTKGATEGINFIASTWADHLQAGDEIILTELEHHANILPWIRLAKLKNITLKYVPVTDRGDINYEQYLKLLNKKTKLVSFVHCSNAIGSQVDAEFIIKHAKLAGAKVLIDIAQSVGHEKIDLHKLGPDFAVFSGHKMLGPTGVGVLYIDRQIQDKVEPYQLGGGMVFEVDCYNASWLKAPQKYEAGTPPIGEVIGLSCAVAYLKKFVDFPKLVEHEAKLCQYFINGAIKIQGIKILGPVDQLCTKGHIVSFISNRMHPHDIAAHLDAHNIAVRAGNHCTQLLYRKLGIDGSVRLSFYLYNTEYEVETVLDALKRIFS